MNTYTQVLLVALKSLGGLCLLSLVPLGFYLRHQWLERRTMREMDGALKRTQTRAQAHMQTTEYRNSSMGRR